MAQTKNFCIEPLNGLNYHNWKFRVEMLMAQENISEFIEEAENYDTITDEARKIEKHRKDKKAQSIIVQCVEDTQLECLRNKKTAYEMWIALKEKYEKKGLPGKMFLKKKLLSMKMKEGESLEKFIHDFEEIVRQLKSADSELKDEDLTCTLLLSLPPSYDTMVTVIENLPDLTFEMVKTKLLAEYEKRTVSTEGRKEFATPMAFEVQNGCFKCGKIGNFKRDCRSRGHGYNRGYNRGFNRGYNRGHNHTSTSKQNHYDYNQAHRFRLGRRLS